MALPAGVEGCLPGVLAMDKDEVFRVIDSAIAFAAWRWPKELEARRSRIVNGLPKPSVNHNEMKRGVEVEAETGNSDFGGNSTHDHEKIKEKMELITPIVTKEAPKNFVVRLHVPNIVRKTTGVIENRTHDPQKIKEKIEAIKPITTKEAPKNYVVPLHVPKAVAGATCVIVKGKSNNPSSDVKGKEYSCGMKRERPKNVDFSQEKLEFLSSKLRERYQECQGSRKRSRVIPFHEAPQSRIRVCGANARKK